MKLGRRRGNGSVIHVIPAQVLWLRPQGMAVPSCQALFPDVLGGKYSAAVGLQPLASFDQEHYIVDRPNITVTTQKSCLSSKTYVTVIIK
jgi:hypothetical protein